MEVYKSQYLNYGKDALMRYQQLAVDWYGNKWPLNYSELERLVLEKNPNFLLALGDAAYKTKFGQRRTNEAMERVLDKTSINPLQIPSMTTFLNGFIEEVTSFDFSLLGDASLELAEQVTTPIKEVFVGVADTAVSTAKNLKWIVLAIVGVGLILLYKVSKKKML